MLLSKIVIDISVISDYNNNSIKSNILSKYFPKL